MQILIINNHSKHIQSLMALFSQYGEVICIDKDNLITVDYTRYDLLVLSGWGDFPVLENPDYYQQELDIIRTTPFPLIGICLWAELITCAFGGVLKRMPSKLDKDIVLTYLDGSLMCINPNLKVAERHRWCITDLGGELEWLARSASWYEVIKHKKRPIYGLQFHPEIDPKHLGGDEILDLIIRSGLSI